MLGDLRKDTCALWAWVSASTLRRWLDLVGHVLLSSLDEGHSGRCNKEAGEAAHRLPPSSVGTCSAGRCLPLGHHSRRHPMSPPQGSLQFIFLCEGKGCDMGRQRLQGES